MWNSDHSRLHKTTPRAVHIRSGPMEEVRHIARSQEKHWPKFFRQYRRACMSWVNRRRGTGQQSIHLWSSSRVIYFDRLWIFVDSAPVRLSTVITFLLVFVFVSWRFRSKGWIASLYNGAIAALFTFFLYEILFNLTGGFPPTDVLPLWGVGLLVCSLLLGLLQARRHFALRRLSILLFSAFIVDWFLWVLAGFPFNLPSTQPLNLIAEVFNVTTKLLLPFGYATGLAADREG